MAHGQQLLELLEDFADLHIVAGEERVPASRLLLAAVAPHLRPELRSAAELRWPVAPQVARALVAKSCGVALPCSAAERSALRALLAPKRQDIGWALLLAAVCATAAAYWPIKAPEEFAFRMLSAHVTHIAFKPHITQHHIIYGMCDISHYTRFRVDVGMQHGANETLNIPKLLY